MCLTQTMLLQNKTSWTHVMYIYVSYPLSLGRREHLSVHLCLAVLRSQSGHGHLESHVHREILRTLQVLTHTHTHHTSQSYSLEPFTVSGFKQKLEYAMDVINLIIFITENRTLKAQNEIVNWIMQLVLCAHWLNNKNHCYFEKHVFEENNKNVCRRWKFCCV